MAAKLKPFINIGPGDFIKEELEYRGWGQEDLAQILGLSLHTVSKLVNNKQSITIDIAKLLSKTFGQSPQYWLNLDNNYRLRLQETSKTEKEVYVKAEIYKYMPVREMRKKKWIDPEAQNFNRLVTAVNTFWNIPEPDFSFIEEELLPNFRKSNAFSQFNRYYALTWFRMAQRCAALYEVDAYDYNRLKNLAERISEYARKTKDIAVFLEDLKKVGVKFFVLEHLQKTYIDGATFFAKANPVVVYTQRYNRIDNFWFTMAHELSHVILHLKNARDRKLIYIDNLDKMTDAAESEANQTAEKWLKVPEILQYFEPYRHYVSRERVLECADLLSLHPAIVVGVLQHHEYLDRRYLNDLKRQVSSIIPKMYFAERRLNELTY